MKWIGGLLMFYSSLFSGMIAIASDGDNLNSNISSKASRCNYYVFIDKNGKALEVLQNAHKDIKGGASSKLVEMLNRKKVSHLIASSFGEKLILSLDSNNIKYTVFRGNINTFIEQAVKK